MKFAVSRFLVPLLLLPALAPAQTTDPFSFLSAGRAGGGRVEIMQDPAIRDLVNLHLTQQRRLNGVRGYRISIYMGSGQEANKQADQARARFIALYEAEVKSYKRFEYPYFKVYVGDFRTKSEALRFLKKIESVYPDAFIREDIIAFAD